MDEDLSEIRRVRERFREEITRADAVLFITPEHNRSIPGVLKNPIEAGSRPYGKSVLR